MMLNVFCFLRTLLVVQTGQHGWFTLSMVIRVTWNSANYLCLSVMSRYDICQSACYCRLIDDRVCCHFIGCSCCPFQSVSGRVV